MGCYIRQDASQSYREVLLFSIGAFYELQECSVFILQKHRQPPGDTETSRVQGWRDGKQVRDINRTVTYKPGTTAPKTVPDEGANVASLIDVLKAAE